MLQHMFYSFLGSLINLSRSLYLSSLPTPTHRQGYEASCFLQITDVLRQGAHLHQNVTSEEGRFWRDPGLLSQAKVVGAGRAVTRTPPWP